MFKEVSTKLDFPQREEQILELWKKSDTFKKSVESRKNNPPFVFLEGPPTANGKPGAHHVIVRSIKDLICRYKTMTGHQVQRKGGWDTHGLPVEIEVEKALGISGKDQIEKYGIREFVEKCKSSVFTYEKEWKKLTERIGFWIDMDDPYITLKNEYIESVWWILKQFWEKGLLYQGHKSVPYCPRCGTALSSHEVAQGYESVEDPSIFVKFPIKGKDKAYFLVWTTTPWTLPSNVALAVKGDFEYVSLEYQDEELILAKALVETVFGQTPKSQTPNPKSQIPIIKATYLGKELLGREYEPLFNFVQTEEKGYYVVEGDFVTLDYGTGIVHIAPAFGQDDYETGQKYKLPFIQLVDPKGNLDDRVKNWAGMFVKDADPLITEDLKSRNLLFKEELYKHDYPFCWRCDTPLLYYARSSWFIKTTAFKDRMIEINNQINWYPDYIKHGRFGDWLENNVDWAISRERYWGTPLPIWVCSNSNCSQQYCVGSLDELKSMGINVSNNIELHKPYIDEVTLRCPNCQGDMRRVNEVIDCWFDSGAAHTAQWHYPFENREFTAKTIPADFICEAIDQTRGWFYSLLAIAALLYDKAAYRNCLCTELVLGADGQKMSKSRGNMVDPWDVLNVQGADAIRWYFYTVSPPWNRRIFSADAVSDTLKKFLNTLYNVYGFFVLYANVDHINPKAYEVKVKDRGMMDCWIISEFQTLVKKVRAELDNYQVTDTARAIEVFVDDLSNWYVRRCRDRFWGSAMDNDKISAYLTLYEILVELAKLIAPFTPFVAEEIYQNLVVNLNSEMPQQEGAILGKASLAPTKSTSTPESVHLCDYPNYDESLREAQLEVDMKLVRELVVLGRAARNRVNIKIRQPLAAITVGVRGESDRASVLRLADLIKDELNVKEVKFAEKIDEFADFKLKPAYRSLGKKYSKNVPKIVQALSNMNPESAKSELEVKGHLELVVDDSPIRLSEEDVQVQLEDKGGYAVEVSRSHFVALSVELSDDLIKEGFAREIVNKIQLMRKEANLKVSDRIALYLESTPKIYEAFEANRHYVMRETLTMQQLEKLTDSSYVKEWDINGERAVIGIEKCS